MLLATQDSIAANDSALEHSVTRSEPEEPDTGEQGWGVKIIMFPLVFTQLSKGSGWIQKDADTKASASFGVSPKDADLGWNKQAN